MHHKTVAAMNFLGRSRGVRGERHIRAGLGGRVSLRDIAPGLADAQYLTMSLFLLG